MPDNALVDERVTQRGWRLLASAPAVIALLVVAVQFDDSTMRAVVARAVGLLGLTVAVRTLRWSKAPVPASELAAAESSWVNSLLCSVAGLMVMPASPTDFTSLAVFVVLFALFVVQHRLIPRQS